jgi:ankyrin repeat protein
MTPLMYAARDGRIESAKLLLDRGAAIDAADANGITPLLAAISNNHPAMALLLIERGANVRAVDWYGRTPLWAAVEARNMDVDNATFVNSVDRAPLLPVIETLLAKGVDVNARMLEHAPIRRHMLPTTGTLAWVDFTGQTPFLAAALAADLEVMRLLLKHGADPHLPTFGGTTPLMAAAGVNWVFDQTFDEGPAARLTAVKLCHELGMDVNAVNSMGLTALHGAANRGSDDIIRFLAEKGARLDVKDKEGRTPLTWAQGVFLATHPAVPKPSSIALISSLQASRP